MEFEGLSGKNRILYDSIWGGNYVLPEGIKEKKNSDNSGSTYKIDGELGDNGELLQKVYEVSNPELFAKKYKLAVSGTGGEAKKIATFHSSSRCALMVFYNAEKKPITVMVDGKPVKFYYTTFEFQNTVIGYPSNMDIVLVNKEQKIVLFLESKFAEYYMSAACESNTIGTSYRSNKYSKEIYTPEVIERLGLGIGDKEYKKDDGKTLSGIQLLSEEPVYLDGIKQMISHYVGIRNRIDNPEKKYACDEKRKALDNNDVQEILEIIKSKDGKVYLGEILFDIFPEKVDVENENHPDTARERYSKLYKKLAAVLNSQIATEKLSDKFKVLDEDLCYSDIFKDNPEIEEKIRHFYRATCV